MVEAQNGHILRRNRRQIQETSPSRRRVRFVNDPAGEMQTLRTQTAEEASSPQRRGERQHTIPADVDTSVGRAVADDTNDITHHTYHTWSGRAVSKPKRLDL